MNNRIMATLFALAIALFIGVVPVKAEAACNHTATKYVCDDTAHTMVCKSCNTVIGKAVKHSDWTYVQSADGQHIKTCGVCSHKVTEAHTAEASGTTCRCKYCSKLMDHTIETESDNTHHWDACEVCAYETTKEEHTWSVTKNGDGTHTKTCTVCEKEVTTTCKDSTKDTDCVCDTCGEAVENATHKLVDVAGVAATCTEPGVSSHKKCEYCGKLYSASIAGKEITEADTVVKAKDHAPYSSWDNSDDTYHWHNCGNADCKEQIDKAEHTFKWGYDANGHYQYCEVCKYVKVEYQAHDYARTSKGDDKHETKCKICEYVMGGSLQNCVDTDSDKDCLCDGCGGKMDHTKRDLTNTSRFTKVHKTATCTEDGIWLHYQCNFCGMRLRESNGKYTVLDENTMVNPKTDHKLVWNHGEAGHYQVCENVINDKQCDYKTEIAEHSYVYTDNGNGTHDARCSVCNRGINDERHSDSDTDNDCVCDGAGCGHVMTHVRSDLTYHAHVKATCLKDGHVAYFTCNTCGEVLRESTTNAGTYVPYTKETKLEALGHDWVFNGKANGLHWATCQRTGCTVTDNLPHTDTDGDCLCDLDNCGELVHSHKLVFVAEVAATCGQDGTEGYYYYTACGKKFDLDQKPITAPATIPATGHTAGKAWEVVDGDVHAKKCADCGEVMDTAAHTDSNNDNRCDGCTVELALEYVAQVDPTCTNVGYKGYWVSKVTGKKYADENGAQYIASVEKIPALGHQLGLPVANGTMHVQTCDREGCTHSEQYAHTSTVKKCFCDTCGVSICGSWEEVKGVAATCETNGALPYIKCSCGKMYNLADGAEITEAVTVKATGHNWSNTLQKSRSEGDHYQVCLNCNKELHNDHVGTLSDPLKGNYHQWTCVCGDVETEVHYDKDGDNKCDECNHDMANTTVNVQQHDSTTVVTGEKKTVDTSKSWWQNWLSNLIPSTSGGTSTSKTSTSESTSTNTGSSSVSASSSTSTGSTTTNGSGSTTGSTSSNTGSTSSNTGSDSSNTSTSTGIINEFIQWLSQLFNMFLQK